MFEFYKEFLENPLFNKRRFEFRAIVVPTPHILCYFRWYGVASVRASGRACTHACCVGPERGRCGGGFPVFRTPCQTRSDVCFALVKNARINF